MVAKGGRAQSPSRTTAIVAGMWPSTGLRWQLVCVGVYGSVCTKALYVAVHFGDSSLRPVNAAIGGAKREFFA